MKTIVCLEGINKNDLHNVCNSYGKQEALLVGKVVEIILEKGIMKVEIVRLVSGMKVAYECGCYYFTMIL